MLQGWARVLIVPNDDSGRRLDLASAIHLDLLVGLALLIKVFHVIEILEPQQGDQTLALATLVGIGFSCLHIENIWFTVLSDAVSATVILSGHDGLKGVRIDVHGSVSRRTSLAPSC